MSSFVKSMYMEMLHYKFQLKLLHIFLINWNYEFNKYMYNRVSVTNTTLQP